jgi:CheY-like chemotaxis protein
VPAPPRKLASVRPAAASAPREGATVPGLLDSQLSDLAELFPDRAPSQTDAAAGPAKEIRCDALLVDDSEIALRFLEIKLGELGLRSRTATDSDKALEQLSQHEFKYVFLDVELGQASRMDGLTLCRHIKRMRRSGRAPVVAMVSAHATQTDRVRGSLAGCDAYLGKPLVANELLAVVGLRR